MIGPTDDDLIAQMDWDALDKILGGPITPGPKHLIITNPTLTPKQFWETWMQQPPEERGGR